MAVQIGAKPDSGFNDPLGMLRDCHRRIARFLGILCRVACQAQGRALSSDEQGAVEAALHYFGESGPRHNMDEEDSLFPRLRALKAAAVLEELRRLETEHGAAGALHDETAELYSKWIAYEGLSSSEETRLLSITEEMQKLYLEHIHVEENIVFPFAAKRLSSTTLVEVGSEFRIRRQRA